MRIRTGFLRPSMTFVSAMIIISSFQGFAQAQSLAELESKIEKNLNQVQVLQREHQSRQQDLINYDQQVTAPIRNYLNNNQAQYFSVVNAIYNIDKQMAYHQDFYNQNWNFAFANCYFYPNGTYNCNSLQALQSADIAVSAKTNFLNLAQQRWVIIQNNLFLLNQFPQAQLDLQNSITVLRAKHSLVKKTQKEIEDLVSENKELATKISSMKSEKPKIVEQSEVVAKSNQDSMKELDAKVESIEKLTADLAAKAKARQAALKRIKDSVDGTKPLDLNFGDN